MSGEKSALLRDDTERYHEHNIHIKNRTIYFYGEVDEFTANEFIKNINILDAVSDEPIIVDINSAGGEVDNGWAIYDRIRQSKSRIIAKVWGDCSSMATIILQACDEREASENSLFLFHEGTAEKDVDHVRNFESYVKLLPLDRDRTYKVYHEATGLTRNRLEKLFTFDKFITAQTALDMGFIDKINENDHPEWYKDRIRNKKIKKK